MNVTASENADGPDWLVATGALGDGVPLSTVLLRRCECGYAVSSSAAALLRRLVAAIDRADRAYASRMDTRSTSDRIGWVLS